MENGISIMKSSSGYKSISGADTIKDIDEKGQVKFYYYSFGNVDSDKDIIDKGAGLKSIQENFNRVKHLKNHNINMSPGKVVELGEDDKGGWMISKLNLNTTMGKDTYEEYKAGQITEHSVRLDVIKEDVDNENGIRIIKEMRIWEGSSLLAWGANEQTPAMSLKSMEDIYVYLSKLKRLRKGDFSDEYFINLEQEIEQVQKHINTITQPGQSTEPNIDALLLDTLNNYF